VTTATASARPVEACLVDLFQHLGITEAHIAAGQMVRNDRYGLATRYPHRVASLTLVSPMTLDTSEIGGLASRMLVMAGDQGRSAQGAIRFRGAFERVVTHPARLRMPSMVGCDDRSGQRNRPGDLRLSRSPSGPDGVIAREGRGGGGDFLPHSRCSRSRSSSMSMRLITRLCQQALIAAAEAALPLRVVVEPAAIGPPLLRGCCDRRAHRASQAHRQQQRRDDAPHGPVGLFRSCATARRAHRQAAFVIIDPCPARPDRFGVLPALCGGERLFGVKQPALDFPLGQWLGHFGCSVWRDLGARSADEPQRHLAVAQGDELAGEGVAQWPDRQMRVLPQ